MDARADPPNDARQRGFAARSALWLLLLFAFALGFMQPAVRVLGFAAVPSDFIFLLLALAWGSALLTGQAKLSWHPAWWLLILYFGAMCASLLASADPAGSAAKLLTQAYLLGIPVIANSLVEDRRDLGRVILWWLAATAVVAIVGIATFIAFYLAPDSALLDRTLFHFGTLMPGNYPRFRLTFLNANLLCNYLSVSLVLLFVADRAGWIPRTLALPLGGGILFAALFTISPGLGGVALVIGLLLWLGLPRERRLVRRTALAAGIAGALLFLPAMALTPILHSTAPYLIRLPLVDLTLAPAGRLMIWTQALANFLDRPLLGRGIGADAVLVRYQDPSGHLQRLTDAHNSFLNIAVQCGLPGLLALVLIVYAAWRLGRPFKAGHLSISNALAVAFLGAFAYQGLGGSYEDARHLWLLFGLLVASRRIEQRTEMHSGARTI